MTTPLTAKGAERLREQLGRLKSIERPKIIAGRSTCTGRCH
jgi:transcription elongation GreA/GreB family factor